MSTTKTIKEHADAIKASGTRCTCDLDNWEPERDCGHSCVCQIRKLALSAYRQERGLGS